MKSRPTIAELFREVEYPIELYNKQGKPIYYENDRGDWHKYEYDTQGNLTYWEASNGYWSQYEYDDQGKEAYYENNNGCWYRTEYDEKGNRTYIGDSNREKRGTPKSQTNKVEIDDSDIAVIEALRDVLIDNHGYTEDSPPIQRAKKLIEKMYNPQSNKTK